MIDRIEFAMLNKIEKVGNLDHEHSVLLEKQCNAFNEATKVCDMGEHVVGEEHVRLLPLLRRVAAPDPG